MTSPVSFGYKMAWLAVPTDDPRAAMEALALEDVEASPWAEGIESVYTLDAMADRPVFVTPALDGWTLIVSPGFFHELSDAEPGRLAAFVGDVARRLVTEVQLFATHRVVEGHAWARADPEGVSRAFYYLGEIGERLIDEGEPTHIELSIDMDSPGEEAVMTVAGAWSLDPTRLEEEHPKAGEGWLGRLPGPASEPLAEAEPREGTRRTWWKFW